MAGELWLASAALGVESVYGTAVAATRRVYWRDPVLTRERTYHEKRYATGRRANVMNAKLGAVVAGGRFVQEVSADEMVETLLLGVQGGRTPTNLGSGAYQWDFAPGNGPLDSATLEGNDGANDWQEYGVYINQIRLAGTPGDGENLLTNDLFGKERVLLGTPADPAQRTPSSIEGWETAVYIDGFGAYGTTLIEHAVTSWDLTFNNNLGRKYFADNTLETGKVTVGQVDVTLEVGFEASTAIADAEYANWDAATKRSIQFVFGGNELIGGSYYKTVKLTVHGAWAAMDTGQSGAGTREYRARLTGVFEPTLGDVIQWQLINDRATAWGA